MKFYIIHSGPWISGDKKAQPAGRAFLCSLRLSPNRPHIITESMQPCLDLPGYFLITI